MKKCKLHFGRLIACILLPLTLSAGCAHQTPPAKERSCRIVLAQDDRFACSENIKTVARGDDVRFSLSFENGYSFGGASYSDCEIADVSMDGEGRRSVSLVLHEVKYSAFVTVDVETVQKIYTVSLEESEQFRCERPSVQTEEFGSATFVLYFADGYTFGGVDYAGGYTVNGADSKPDANGERRVSLTLNQITGSVSVTVTAKEAEQPPIVDPDDPDPPDEPDEPEIPLTPVENAAVIGYVLNGGSFLDTENSGTYFTVSDALMRNRRPNTSVGTDVMKREGYVLTGWNTKADGSGLHIGLGSRATVGRGETLLLYAEWEEQTDGSQFEYGFINRSEVDRLYRYIGNKKDALRKAMASCNSTDRVAVVIKYLGKEEEKVVIPERVGQDSVAVIAPDAFENHGEIKSVVFPLSIQYVMENAFRNCNALCKVTLSDNLLYFDGIAFGEKNAVETLRLNAATPPIYGLEETGQFANKIELIADDREAPKTVLFGSCSLWYGMDTQMFRERTGQDAYNLGVIGGTCARYQIDIIRQYLHENDSFIYVMELGSPYQLLYDVSWDERVFRTVENNYDLIASLDLRRYANVFPSLGDYLFVKGQAVAEGMTGSYDDFFPHMSPYGDLTKEREGGYDNEGHMYEIRTPQELSYNNAYLRIDETVREITDSGVSFYLSFGPLNEESVEGNLIAQLNRDFSIQFGSNQTPLTMIGGIASSVLPSRYFYDTNYHLSTEGTKVFTEIFLDNYFHNTYYFGKR